MQPRPVTSRFAVGLSRFGRVRLAVAALTLAMTGSVFAQTAKPFLVIDHAGLGSLFADPRDEGLRDALAMIPARIAELPGEIGDMPPEAAAYIELALETIAKPARIAITYDGDNPSGGFFGYGFIASIACANRDEADEIQDAILELTSNLADQSGGEFAFKDSERFENMQQIMLPFGLVSFGPRHDDDTWRYELIVGTINNPDEAFTDLPQLIDAQGYEPFLRGQLDLSTLTPASRIVTNFAGANAPQAGAYIAKFENMGLIGEDAMKLDFESGRTPEMTMQRYTLRGAAQYAQALSLPLGHLNADDIAAVPADVYSVMIGKADFDSIQRTLDSLQENGVPVYDALAQFEDMTDVNLVEDVFGTLGGTFAIYNAESTGGGSLLSTVLMVTVDDREQLTQAIGRLADFANAVLDDDSDDVPGEYIEFDPWTDHNIQLLSLRFPGLPVPLELTFAMTENWFIAAPTPQAALAAARQADGHGDDGLGANPRLAPFIKEHGAGATSLSFVDSARTLRSGYPFLTLIASALSNGVRSPGDIDARDPGMILPLYNDLMTEHLVPTVRISAWDGDDLVTSMWSDSSLWVQAGSGLGAASAAIPLIAAGVGAATIASKNGWDMGLAEPTVPLLEQSMAMADLVRRAVFVDPLSQASATALALTNPEFKGVQGMLPAQWILPH